MSSYVVLARRWRPRSFDALVGQQHVVQALQNAIRTGRVPHAFLFSGTRGVGKTTLARILAMRLNCRQTTTPEPCGGCDSCQEVIAGAHPDVMEIDAASRTKVEQMRELLELAPYAPASSPFKVFILDEIHMLSTQSFNALLKTLEEPPAHVKFIFATTEPRKIPATILSRCQRHDLKRLTVPQLIGHLETILRQEGIAWDEAALEAVARAADGSVRDGLSLLDQVIAHGQGEVRHAAVHGLLGLTDLEAVERLLDQVLAGQGSAVLQAAEQFHLAGVEPLAVVRDLLDRVHRRTRERVVRGASAGGSGPSLEQLQMVYQTFLKGEGEIKLAEQPAQALEMLLLRAAYLKPIPDLDKIIAMLVSGSGGPPAVPAGIPSVVASGAAPAFSMPPGAEPSAIRPVLSGSVTITKPPSSLEKEQQESATVTAWEGLLSSAVGHGQEIARKMWGQVACLSFDAERSEGERWLRLRLVDECFGTPERMTELMGELLQGCGRSDIRVRVEPASSASRPETLQERAERLEKELRYKLEQELLARPDVQRLITTFSARMIAVEPLAARVDPTDGVRMEGRA
ncbi:MAG: DNA polymerase III subunit gamma/tau [Magnetococcales bacterium]|nr:DNA polymerase III subunit gamma/tau [Magnetococcales bacterium]